VEEAYLAHERLTQAVGVEALTDLVSVEQAVDEADADGDGGSRTQRRFSAALEKAMRERWAESQGATTWMKYQLDGLAGFCGVSWAHATPAIQDLQLDTAQFRALTRRTLGLELPSLLAGVQARVRCCQGRLLRDAFGHHTMACPLNRQAEGRQPAGRYPHHDGIRDAFLRFVSEMGMSAGHQGCNALLRGEDAGQSDKVVDGYVYGFPQRGLAQTGTTEAARTRTMLFDVTCVRTRDPPGGARQEAAREQAAFGLCGTKAGGQAAAAESRKRATYGSECADKGFRLVPLAFEHESGILGPEGVEAVEDLAAQLASQVVWGRRFGTAGRARSELKRWLEHRLAVACAKGTANRLLTAAGTRETTRREVTWAVPHARRRLGGGRGGGRGTLVFRR